MLRNLQVKRDAIDKLPFKLPFSVVCGHIGELQVKIPWMELESKSVRILINDICILLNPLDLTQMDSNEVILRLCDIVKGKLLQAEKAIESFAKIQAKDLSRLYMEDDENLSYMKTLGTKVMENLEITLSKVHIRYEDCNISFKNKTFSFGLTLATLIISTTNSSWEGVFVSTASNATSTSSNSNNDSSVANKRFKLLKIINLGIYWNVLESILCSILPTSPQIIERMKAMIITDENKDKVHFTHDFLLHPNNSLTLKLIHDNIGNGHVNVSHQSSSTHVQVPSTAIERKSEYGQNNCINAQEEAKMTNMLKNNIPKLSVHVQSLGLQFKLDKLQYHQWCHFTAITDSVLYEQRLVVLKHRPTVSPSRAPRLWWRYAYDLIVTKHFRVISKQQQVSVCV